MKAAMVWLDTATVPLWLVLLLAGVLISVPALWRRLR